MESGHAWSERRKCCNHSSAARRSTGSWLVYSAATARPRDARSGGGGAGAIPAPGEDAIAPERARRGVSGDIAFRDLASGGGSTVRSRAVRF